VNETAGRALFYVFAEAAEAASLPLVLWLKCAPAPRAPAAGGGRAGAADGARAARRQRRAGLQQPGRRLPERAGALLPDQPAGPPAAQRLHLDPGGQHHLPGEPRLCGLELQQHVRRRGRWCAARPAPGAGGGRRAGLRARAGARPAQATRAPLPTLTYFWRSLWSASPRTRAVSCGWRASPTAATMCARCLGWPGVRSLLEGAGRERAGARRAGAQPGARDCAAPTRRARRPAAPQPAGLPRGCAGSDPAGAPRPRRSARAERRGCRAGNAWTDAAVDNGGAVDFWWSHAMISDVRPRPAPAARAQPLLRVRLTLPYPDQRGVRAGDARGRAQDVQFQQHRPAARRARA
jgi:hypothetical protein